MINFFKRLYNTPIKVINSDKKIDILHIIHTNKHKYVLYTVDSEKVLSIEQDGLEILQNEVNDETCELMGGTCFETVVGRCLYNLRKYIEKQKEVIITDRIMDKSEIRKEKIKEIFNDIS